MNIIVYFIIGLTTVNVLNGYVLLQVRKGDNHSDVDALIHKVIPANKFEKFADTARKHFKNFKQYKVKSQNSDKDLESIVFAIKTDDAKGGNEGNKYGRPRRENINVDSFLSDLKQFVMNFVKPDAERPSFRSKMEKYNIKPVQLRNGDPSMMYEIETNSVLKSLTDALNSPNARRYSENIAKTAAYVYPTEINQLKDVTQGTEAVLSTKNNETQKIIVTAGLLRGNNETEDVTQWNIADLFRKHNVTLKIRVTVDLTREGNKTNDIKQWTLADLLKNHRGTQNIVVTADLLREDNEINHDKQWAMTNFIRKHNVTQNIKVEVDFTSQGNETKDVTQWTIANLQRKSNGTQKKIEIASSQTLSKQIKEGIVKAKNSIKGFYNKTMRNAKKAYNRWTWAKNFVIKEMKRGARDFLNKKTKYERPKGK